MTRLAHHWQTQIMDDDVQVPSLLAKMFAAEVDADTGCWNWPYATVFGYGRVAVVGTDGVRRGLMAHRVSFELFHHPIAEDLQVDHLCMNRACVNPDHLEAVTQQENIRRQRLAKYGPPKVKATKPTPVVVARCKRGHDLALAYVTAEGKRQCRTCKRIGERQRRSERAA